MSEENEAAPSPEVPERNRGESLTFEEVKGALEGAFPDAHARLWANEAWAALIKLGLASFTNELERCEAALRFIAFTGFYKDWQAQAEECDRAFDYGEMLPALRLTPFRLGQLIGRHSDFLDDADFDPYTSLNRDEQLLKRAMLHLEFEARSAVVTALMAHYGGASGLFVALWNSDKQPRPADYDQKWEKYDSQRAWDMEHLHMWVPPYQDTDDEILNDVTGDKLRLWTWLDQGAKPRQRHCLDPEAAVALGGVCPERAWEELKTLVQQAIDTQYDQAEKLIKTMNREPDLEHIDFTVLCELLDRMNPIEGVNDFHYINGTFNLQKVLSIEPIEVLKGVIRILTVSDRWAARH